MTKKYSPWKLLTAMLMTGMFLGLGCGQSDSTTICVQGELQACPCLAGGESVQACAEDRQGWAPCQCDIQEGSDGVDDGAGGRSLDTAGTDGNDSGGGDTDKGGADTGGANSGGADADDEDSAGPAENGAGGGGSDGSGPTGVGADQNGPMGIGMNIGGADGGDAVSGGATAEGNDGRLVTLWAHTFNETLGPGSGLQPGDMETDGAQGYTDSGSWTSMGGWLSKTISTVGYNTINVGYLLTKDESSTCDLDVSIDGGSTWTNVVSDMGPGWYRLDATLPTSAEGEEQVVLKWTSRTDWCWINEITITAFEDNAEETAVNGEDRRAENDEDARAPQPVFHVFLLMGQSNMVGCDLITPEDRTSDERVSVLGYETCPGTQRIVNQWDTALPPLHTCSGGIGPGDYFAKTLAAALPEGHTMGLVPTAVSGQWIETFLEGGVHHQNILDKIQLASGVENAKFSGIIFHQGESNNGDQTWPGKVQQLYTQVKGAMGLEDDIPFIAGEMLYGGNCEEHNALVRQVPNLGSHFDYVSAEGLAMAPGDEWLVHFDHQSQVTLGRRYGQKMRAALGW